MPWSVENTDEFTDWWNELTEALQEDITVAAELLMEHVRICRFRVLRASKIPGTLICENYAYKAVVVRSGFSMPSIQDARQFC